MSKIQIANLQPAGAELFQGGESFLTELQTTEAHKIHGGSKRRNTIVVVGGGFPFFGGAPFFGGFPGFFPGGFFF